MTRSCVIERWVQRKTDQKLIFNGNYTQIVFFFVFRIYFHYVLSYLFGLFGVRTCVSILWHTSLPKNATLLEKIAKNHDFGDFWWFSCFWHDVTYDVTVASYKVCLYLFWYQWTREGHSYSLVPHTWYFVNRFPRWGGGAESAPGCEMGPKSPALLGLNSIYNLIQKEGQGSKLLQTLPIWLVKVLAIEDRILYRCVSIYSVSHTTRNLFLTGSSAVAEKHTSIIFKKCIVRGLNFICGYF